MSTLLLVAITLALIFSEKFRKDVIGGDNDAKILGLISVKGAVIIVLSALFLGGAIYPLKYVDAAFVEPEVEKSGLLKNGEYCYKNGECDSNSCYPAPGSDSPSPPPGICMAMDRNCALPKLDGAMYGTRVYHNGSVLVCADPKNGQSAQFISTWRLPK